METCTTPIGTVRASRCVSSSPAFEIKKNKSKDKSVKEYLISKQIREAISLSAGSLLLADGINNKSYDKKTKPWLIGLSITAWGASIINNLTAYYNYKKENRQEIVE